MAAMHKTSASIALVALGLCGCGGGHGSTGSGGGVQDTADSIPKSWTVGAWYIDPANVTGKASDTNSCKSATAPCQTFAEIATQWGTYAPRLRQNTTITFLSSHSDDSDPVYLNPYIEHGAVVTVEGTLGTHQQVASGALSYVVPKRRSSAQLLEVELPAGVAPGQLVVNVSKGSRAWIYKNAGGNSWYLSQPLAPQVLPLTPGTAPAEANNWAAGDAVTVYRPVAVDLAAASPVAGPDGVASPLTFYQLRVLSPSAGADAGSNGRSTLAISSPDVAFVEASIDRFVSIGENSFSDRPDFVNVDSSGGLAAKGLTAAAGMSVMAGQVRSAAWSVSAGTFDDDVVLGSAVWMAGGSYGTVFVDSSAALFVQQNAVQFTQANGAPVLWGPGSVDAVTEGHLEYPAGAGMAQATFQVAGLYIDAPPTAVLAQPLPVATTACAVNTGSGWQCGIAVTAVDLDAPVGAGGFGGTAIDPGGSTITNSVPVGSAPFQSDMILWLRADRGVTLATDGSVAIWADQTGLGGRDAAPLFPGMPGPLYVPNAYGNLPAMRGDGTRSLMVNGGHGYPVGNQSTLFLVASPSTTNTEGVTYYNESTQGWQYAIDQDSAGVHWLNFINVNVPGGSTFTFTPASAIDTFLFTPPPAPGLHVYAMSQQDGVQGTGYYDGAQVATIVPKAASRYVMSVLGGPGDAFNANDGGYDPEGVIISSGAFDTNGDLQEVIQYGRELSPTEVGQVNAYLQGRWSGSSAQPSPDGGVPEGGAPDGGAPEGGSLDGGAGPETGPSSACPYQAATAPAGPAVCGDGWRDPATEECDDGLGDAGLRRGCSSACGVVDELDIANLGADGGLANTSRTLGGGRHPVAAGVQTFAVVSLETPSSPPTVALTTFTRKGAATGVVTAMSAGSVVSDNGDPVVASLPCDQYAVAWNDLSGDGDGLGVALRLFDPPAVTTGTPAFANTTTAFDQYAPDILWTGSSLVVAWTDTSNATTGPDVLYRTFDSTLRPTSDEQTLAASPDIEGDVTLAAFEGSWAAAWRDDANGLEQIRVHTGNTDWTVGPGFVPPSVTTKLALVELDSTDLLLLYSVGAPLTDAGVPDAISTLYAAVVSLSASGAVSGTPVPVNTAVEGATAASLSHAYAAAVRVGTSVYAAWWTDAVVGSAAGEQVWFQSVGWSAGALSWTGTELLLPRTAAHRTGNQRAPAMAASTLEPGGALVGAWDDLGKTLGVGEGNGDVAVELVPVPVLRIGPQ